MHLSRRAFLGATSVASLSALLPRGFAAEGLIPRLIRSDRYLILVQLSGGNDGLNTLCPYNDLNYQKARPKLRLKLKSQSPASNLECLPLPALTGVDTTDWGIHKALETLLPAWNAGELAFVRGLGYPNPNRSHFRGIDIWDTAATDDDAMVQDRSGWTGRGVVAEGLTGELDVPTVVFGGADETPTFHPQLGTFSVGSVGEFVDRSDDLPNPTDTQLATTNPALKHLLTIQRKVATTRASFQKAKAASTALDPQFDDDSFNRQCRETAACITSGMKIPVYKLEIGGFDTHANQPREHADRLTKLAKGLATLRTALGSAWSQTLVMTYSEFGRRFHENDSSGTDHGTVNTHLVLGGGVKGGLYGSQPSMADVDLDDRDMVYTTDFRRLVASALDWIGVSESHRSTALNPWGNPSPPTWTPLPLLRA